MPIYILLVASIFAVALFSLPWASSSGKFKAETTMKLPDITVTDISWSRLKADEIRITATVSNIGFAAARGFNVRFFDVNKGEAVGFTTISNLASGEQTTTSITHTEKSLVCPMIVTADWGNLIMESDETNNEAETTLVLG
jgi:subtilase family serine protease